MKRQDSLGNAGGVVNDSVVANATANSADLADKNARRAIYEFSVGLRATHWLRFAAILVLTVTGFYMSFAFQSPMPVDEPVKFMQAKYRFIHEVAGFVLIGCILVKSYLFLFDKVSAKERHSWHDVFHWRVWLAQIKFYLFLDKHPRLQDAYNPLQFLTYVVFYLICFGIILTGLVLYAHSYHDGLGGLIYGVSRYVEALFGGLAEVRTWHRIFMWAIIVFVPIHIYLAIFNTIKGRDGALDAVIGGYKFEK